MKQKLKIYGKGTSARRPASLFSKASGALILCMAALVIPGCVSTEEIGAMRYEINMLNTEVRNLKAATGDRSKDNATEQNLLEIKESQATSAKSAAELYVRIEELSSEFKILTGRFEEARYYSEKKAMEMVEDRDMLLARITKLQEQLSEMKERPTPIAAPVVPEASTKPSPKTIATLKPDSETEKVILPPAVKDVYMEGYQLFKAGNMPEAREKFNAVANKFKTNEYSDNALFWIGETYYQEEKYEDAILAYEDLFKKFSDSDKVPGAMLKQGLAFYAIKNTKLGNIMFEKLIKRFPESDQAELAKKKMKLKVVPKKNK